MFAHLRQNCSRPAILSMNLSLSVEVDVCGEALSELVKCSDDKMIRFLLENDMARSFETLRQAYSARVLEAVIMLLDKGICRG